MNKVLVMIAGATLGLSFVTFAADTVSSAPAPAATTSAPAKTLHHKKQVKKANTAEQKAQAAKKHVKKDKAAQPTATTPAAR
ncbi:MULTISPECIES: acid resistance repetitive basic protein Asr [Brenneria]|uniref:Acid resistance repetitive basic protein Asr n=1 Tax=Brenneria nigrifluens DSM 30175 = ATCC 13028 TaxID=1121120 RepID=A0A2U1UIG0_9GAMM|nr:MULTISPECIES: acid resistance repetitive basic protein Asr [Brenneria]PWC21459.1 acid-shock protein [Brenneria nigrifluens] [Brenneria nigrifluens DSM 30175 = ATCC 13028]QCR04357.1 acid resistance repetitive basic protein Asr [Brenneria nigrifluens DSM 30175 = ATCC 13028]